MTGDAMRKPSRATCLAAFLLAAGGLVPGLTLAQPTPATCGPLQALLFDYRTDQKQYKVVEEFHFTPEVEALVRGKSGTLGQELNYTLSNVPNHHRALISLTRYGEKMKSPQPPDLRYPIECYFERALRFKPDDNVARLLYANYLAHGQRTADATRQLEIAASNAGDNAFTHYNIGLIYSEMKAYDRALAQAHKAAALGFGRTALRDQLQAAGKWREPTVAIPDAAGASAAAPASAANPAPSATAAEVGSSAASAASAAAN